MNKYETIQEQIKNNNLGGRNISYLLKLVELHTPKKVNGYECPNCHSITGLFELDFDIIKRHDFCSNCGQALDWNGEE